jgi:cellulose synthase operon protein C
MLKQISLIVGIALFVCVPSANACGEFFGTSVLENRQSTLLTLWDASFALESSRLVPPPEGLTWANWKDASGERIDADEQAKQLRERTLTPPQLVEFERLVVEGSSSSTNALSEGQSAYALGAHHYKAERFREALKSFEKASQGKATEKNPWPLVAAYMAARSQLALDELEPAAKAFERVTQRAQQGETDPLSLGARALSEAATAHQRAGHWVQAVALQMSQAALNVPGADVSLRWRVEAALRSEKATTALLADATTRDAVILYALAFLPAVGGSDWSLSRHGVPWKEYREMSDEARAALPADLTSESLMAAIASSLEGVKPDEVRGADRLAALLYRRGQYEASRPFAAASTSPLSYWVSAKLALRDGDRDKARDMYAKTIELYPANEDWGNDSLDAPAARIPACRAETEAAILTLQRGEAVESLELFLRAGAIYWNDAAYLAERVLSIDELSALVSRLPDLKIAPSVRTVPEPLDSLELVERRGEVVDDPRAAMSDLLARRLMRAGRYEEGLALFTDPSIRNKAASYQSLLKEAEAEKATVRAETLFKAARLARQDGMDMLAFESSPDWAVHDGQYSHPSSLEKIMGYKFKEDETQYWVAGEDAPWIADSERKRVNDNSNQSSPRFTYRLTAAELANRAADELPRDSQAFAAVLCHATSWLLTREPALARKYYQRYRDEGQQQSWSREFGQKCPAPQWRT